MNWVSPTIDKIYDPLELYSPTVWSSETYDQFYRKYTPIQLKLFTRGVKKLLVSSDTFSLTHLLSMFSNLVELDISYMKISLAEVSSNTIKILRINGYKGTIIILKVNIPNLHTLYAKNTNISDMKEYLQIANLKNIILN
jgi:hypothetical protein